MPAPPARLTPRAAPMAFLSDLHGNLEAFDAVLAELERRVVRDIYVAGDLLLGGPDPVGVYKRLQQVGARCTRGLGDRALTDVRPERLNPEGAEQAAAAARFAQTRAELGDLALRFLSQLPERLRIPMVDGSETVMVHGSPADPTVEMGHDLGDEELLALTAGDPAELIICGATHVPYIREIEDGVRVVNVGSVGAAPEGRTAHFTVVQPKMDGAIVEQDWVEY